MGNCTACNYDELHAYNNNPRLIQEIKTGADFLTRFRRINFQYSGDFEQVWKVEDKTTHELFSLHERKKTVLNYTSTYSSYAIKENRLVQKLKNPFILELKYACQDQRSLIMITDLIKTRLSLCLKKCQRFTEEEVRYIAASILLALQYIHAEKIIHRDIRPESVVLDHSGRVKLTNFLLAREYDPTINNAIDNTGTVGYMAPEVIQKQQHGFEVDFYALGILLYELMTSEKLFDSGTQDEMLVKMQSLNLKRSDLADKCSPEMVSFLNGLLQFEPKNRLGVHGVRQAFRHRWFAGFDWEGLIVGKMGSPITLKPEEIEQIPLERTIEAQISSKRLSLKNLYLGYQYGFGEPVRNETNNDLSMMSLV